VNPETRFRSAQNVVRRKVHARDQAARIIPCSQCKFRIEPKPGAFHCSHPVYTEVIADPIAGTVELKHRTKAAEARSHDGYCGQEAALFEPIPGLGWGWKAYAAVIALGFGLIIFT
jgi:hypothetical protein